MSTKGERDLRLEIGHVLFIDIVGFSKLLINEQSELLEHLKEMMRGSEQVRAAEAEGKLIRLATGDGMALVFRNSPEAPAQCALELARADKLHPELRLRMGIHSGPINQVTDVNERANVTGGGINMAQRVMDCGDAGHILLSKRAADDLAQYRHWQPLLHDLGECEVKHGVTLSLVNLYTDQLGNPETPQKFKQRPPAPSPPADSRPGSWSKAVRIVLLAVPALGLAAGLLFFARHRSAPPGNEKSIAVLPFENLSDDKQNSYFTDGVQDEILADLAKVADLKVISRTSVMLYKSGNPRNLREIGQQLGVAHVVEGSVQRVANRVRVTAQLIDARTDAHLWAEHYDRPLDDVFAIQSEIAQTIADQLQAKLSPNEKSAIQHRPSTDLAAYDLYVRATDLIDAVPYGQDARESHLQAVGLLDQAVARDPAFLLAYCKLADAHDQLYLGGIDHTVSRLALGQTAVNAALRLQPDSGKAHLAFAHHLYSNLEYDRARSELAIARTTLPNDPRIFELSGYIDRRESRWTDSARNLEHALELDPRNPFILQQISNSYQFLRAYPKAAAALDRVLELKPNDVSTRIQRAGLDLHWRADTRALHALIEALLRENPAAESKFAPIRVFLAMSEHDSAALERALTALGENTFGPNAVEFSRQFGEGVLARMNGDPAAAQAAFIAARIRQEEIVRRQPDYAPALCVLGLIDAGLGRKEEALREGRRAVELLPVAKDSNNGPTMIQVLAMIYTWTGEKDLALEQLRNAAQLPSFLSYGLLRLFPYWDPLRGDPRFEKIVASLAPKDTRQ